PFMIGGQQALGLKVQAWLSQGCPDDVYTLPGAGEAISGNFSVDLDVGQALTDLGNCLPDPELVGSDPELDSRFSRVGSFADLPSALTDTDFVSLDSRVLAKRGTFAYSPTYPLWSDDARKLRYVHVPRGRSIALDPKTQQFSIPANTRFYKTFLREVKIASGETRFRKMETRLIVTREAGASAVYGTYVWNSEETAAKLLGTGLDPASPGKAEETLDRQPFPDYVSTYISDESQPQHRESYQVPGAQRCVSCHSGSASDSFILGWTPTQLKHRKAHEGGVYEDVLPDELGQLDRLASYGVVTGVNEAELTNLEDSALPRKPRTVDELNIQGYMLGNCTHCHNPKGYAVQSSSALAWLDMSPGGAIFGFDFNAERGPRELDGTTHYFARLGSVDPSVGAGNLGPGIFGSGFLRRVLSPTQLLTPSDFGSELSTELAQPKNDLYKHINLHMPLHVSSVDCRLPRLAARWWGSVPRTKDGSEAVNPTEADRREAELAANAAEEWIGKQCAAASKGMKWVIEDRSERFPYVERNLDWRSSDDSDSLPPAWLKALRLTPEHEALAKKRYSLGYFHEGCQFPQEAPAPEHVEPWMITYVTGEPYLPWSQIYDVNASEVVFASICANCHGYRGDAQTGAAQVIRYTSGARVASFVDGLFGPRSSPGSNLSVFDDFASRGPKNKPAAALGPDGAAKYVVWMAYGGTRVAFGRSEDEERDFLRTYVSARAATASPIPLKPDDLTSALVGAKANMLQLAAAICRRIRTPLSPTSGDPAALYDAAVQSGATARNLQWQQVIDAAQGNPFGTPVWRDICTLGNPISEEVANGELESEVVQAWLNRAAANAGLLAYIYMRDELTRGVYAPNYDQCYFRYPANASMSAP
ncbi:MAG TPA: hypothetical protein VHM25_25715, partial [Polyangiaceae bacterium]|nr:hypothetical protein [Polyangiaceae bacterium]